MKPCLNTIAGASHALSSSSALETPKGDHESAEEIAFLRRRTATLEEEVEHRKRLEEALRQALVERVRAEKAMQASQQELSDFIEDAADGIRWVSAEGDILATNRAELELLGYSRSEYVGHNIAEFHMDPEVAVDILARLKRRENLNAYEVRLRARDGSIKHVLMHSSVFMRDGEFVHARSLTRDITDRKKLEEELRRQNEDLLRTVRFSEMFVGILGHDLRNPLSAITTGASILQRRGESEKVVKTASRILNSAGRMGRMIDQVLDFTRIRLGRGIPIQPRRADLNEICRIAIDEFESTAPTRRIAFESRGDTTGMWDADRIVQLVSNLLGNALTHGDPALPVTISCDGASPTAVQLDVHNTGVVPADLLSVLFEPFRSGSNPKQAGSNGLGLGLFISQQIVLAHSGTIHVTSSAEDGTHLIVRLPRDFLVMAPGFTSQGPVRDLS
jgi:PAS domain S-box-containing protein